MKNEFYEKYKQTILKNKQNGRDNRKIWLINSFQDYHCEHCGESETICLRYYPNHKEIYNLNQKYGLKSNKRKEIDELININKVLCVNCIEKTKYDIINYQ